MRVGGDRLEQHAYVLLFHLSGQDNVSCESKSKDFKMMSVRQTNLVQCVPEVSCY